MALFKEYSFPARGVRSLCWRGVDLVDWVGGGRVFARDGSEQPRQVIFMYRFDAAVASPDGRFAVIYERLGTKGLVLKDGQELREINRSYYCAGAYEYPVALFHGPDGRLLLAHCPEGYHRVDLEEAETGRPLTALIGRKPDDYFQSRLTASPGGKRLLSAGWIWQPYDFVVGFDVARGLADAREFDRRGMLPRFSCDGFIVDEASACWLDDDCIAVAGADHEEEDILGETRPPDEPPGLRARGLVVYDLAAGRFLHSHRFAERLGTILPIGRRHVLSLYRHPKLIDLATGQVVHAWTDLPSGLQRSSRLEAGEAPPPMALDPRRNRFAIAADDQITIIEFDLNAR